MRTCRFIGFLLLSLVFRTSTLAGPPFRTDDPIPIGFRHAEIYLFSAAVADAGNGITSYKHYAYYVGIYHQF